MAQFKPFVRPAPLAQQAPTARAYQPQTPQSGSGNSAAAALAPAEGTDSLRQRRTPLTRSAQISWLTADGGPAVRSVTVPATELYESAFNAFARGTLIATPSGPVAIEDLIPGDAVLTHDGDVLPVRWIGSMTLFPDLPVDNPDLVQVTRLLTDHFAPGKPFADLLLGPGARLLGRDAGQAALVPATALRDGVSMFAVRPRQPVQLHHLMLSRHAVILAGQVPVETWHPGPGLAKRIGGTPLAFLMTLFPHLTDPSDFGPLCLPRQDLQADARPAFGQSYDDQHAGSLTIDA